MKLPELQKELRKKKISYLLLTNKDPNFTYFTGLKGTSFALLFVPRKGKPFLFVTSLDKEKTNSSTENVLIEKPWEVNLKKKIKPKVLGYNAQTMTVYAYKKFKKIFPKVKFVDWSKYLCCLRIEKTKQELSSPRKAAKLTVLAFEGIIKGLKKKRFKTENDIKFYLEKFALDNNTELSFPPIVASGKNTRNPHHQTSNQNLKKGFLLLDFGISYQNYCSDMTRMVYLGKPGPRELAMYNFLLDVQVKTIKNLKLGKTAGQIEAQARKDLGKYSSYFIHGLGHGTGIEIHELPSLSPDSEDKIKKNQVFTIEPGIYFKDFGLRIEDTILMKEKPVILTKCTKELVCVSW